MRAVRCSIRLPWPALLLATPLMFWTSSPASAAPAEAPTATTPAGDQIAAIEFFEKKIRPLLVDNCFNCHSANTNSRGGLRVDDRVGLLTGGGRGPAVTPGDPDSSWLIKAVRQTDAKLKMPPMKQLSEQQIADLTRWIQEGAVWPKVEFKLPQGESTPEYARLRKEHWAWQPLRDVKPPDVASSSPAGNKPGGAVWSAADWPRDDIDRFVAAKLLEKGLAPVGDADKATLIRRATFDLTGLPPTLDAIAAFERDETPEAFATVVDRLLASRAFGERWGRHWLDVARYGESTGSARNLPYPHAWRYRDYVLESFHRDKPYDQFLREQIAGDLLPADSDARRDEQRVATGFLALGVKDVNQRFKVRFVMDNVDEQIDTVSRAVLGLTASCARCHDHKFDPIPQTDYYALAGIFCSTDLCAGVRNKMGGGGLDYYDVDMLLKLGPPPSGGAGAGKGVAKKRDALNKELAAARAEAAKYREGKEGAELADDGRPKQVVARERVAKLQTQLAELTDPAMQGPVAYGVRDARTVGDTELRVRGEAEQLGPIVPRGFLKTIAVPDAPSIGSQQSGRLELAEWLVSPHNPLTPRVMANRVWKHLFGQGLVLSVDNFGTTGDAPSHPELLDHLARRFVQDGWSVKKLVRAIVLSRSYRLASDASPTAMRSDPASRYVWRHRPRRLDAEELRDAMLAAADALTLAPPTASPAKELKVIEMRNNGAEAQRLLSGAVDSPHRSVYLPLVRNVTPTSLEVFDFATQGMVTGHRDSTTVPTQALYLLNDPFVLRQAERFAARLQAPPNLTESARVERAYRWALGRAATSVESERALSYLEQYAAADATPSKSEVNLAAWASFCQALLGSAEFRYLQ